MTSESSSVMSTTNESSPPPDGGNGENTPVLALAGNTIGHQYDDSNDNGAVDGIIPANPAAGHQAPSSSMAQQPQRRRGILNIPPEVLDIILRNLPFEEIVQFLCALPHGMRVRHALTGGLTADDFRLIEKALAIRASSGASASAGNASSPHGTQQPGPTAANLHTIPAELIFMTASNLSLDDRINLALTLWRAFSRRIA